MGSVGRRAPGGETTAAVPRPILTYNNRMGGVDLADQLHSYYPVGRPSIKWWRYLCWWLLQSAMVNSFLIFKGSNLPAPTRKGHRHVSYRLEVLRSLCRGNSVRKQSAQQSVSQAGVSATDPLTHGITRLPGRKKNYFLCAKAKIRTDKGYGVQTSSGCHICSVHLCVGTCFAKFHQTLASTL